MVPADLRERPDERQLGHVGGAAVAVVVVVPPFAALVLVPANDRLQSGRQAVISPRVWEPT